MRHIFFFSFFNILGFTCSFTFNGTSRTNVTSTTIEVDTEKFVDYVNSKYPVDSVYSNDGDTDIDGEDGMLEDSDNE